MQKNSTKYIVRFSTVINKSWQFRFPSANDGWKKPFNKNFTDNFYGSKTKALKAAIQFRDNYLKKIGKLHLTNKFTNSKRFRHTLNVSGVLGVQLATKEVNSHIYESWTAYGMINNVGRRKSFSINKYGYVDAFIKACNARYEICGTLSVFCNIKDLPASPGVPYNKVKNEGYQND